MGDDFRQRVTSCSSETATWDIPKGERGYTIKILDDESFFGHFAEDINTSEISIFALAPYFGEYRWPKIQPLFSAALSRDIEITVVTPPLAEAQNKSYVENVIMNLRSLGAVVVSSSGLHGKDVIIDERIVYKGSMNWSSHRGRAEVIHRIDGPRYAKQCLEYLRARHIRQVATNEDGTPRLCPYCGFPIQIVNQRRQHFRWDFQAMKVGCTNPKCKGMSN
jgi:phosphatidylserine/phosphatidylglycerophosphate/cardiolipin synthase-like enzyme